MQMKLIQLIEMIQLWSDTTYIYIHILYIYHTHFISGSSTPLMTAMSPQSRAAHKLRSTMPVALVCSFHWMIYVESIGYHHPICEAICDGWKQRVSLEAPLAAQGSTVQRWQDGEVIWVAFRLWVATSSLQPFPNLPSRQGTFRPRQFGTPCFAAVVNLREMPESDLAKHGRTMSFD